jgi:CRP-like cAMP-binding protein
MIQHAFNPVGFTKSGLHASSASDRSAGPSRDGVSFTTASARRIFFMPAGETIYREGELRRAIFQVAHGLVRTVKQTSEGRRIVHSFCVPGDIFGMSCTSTYIATAEAVSDLHLIKFEPGQFDTWLESDGTSARQLWSWMVRASERVDQLRLMARGRSVEKVSYFLLDLAERMSARSRIELQMSRYDIGDYLGLSSETVSRAFTSLRARNFIATDGRVVYLRNPSGLQQLSMGCSTRQEQG